jgi:hypothetical protein
MVKVKCKIYEKSPIGPIRTLVTLMLYIGPTCVEVLNKNKHTALNTENFLTRMIFRLFKYAVSAVAYLLGLYSIEC